MGKGLKQMVAEAEAQADDTPEPVFISGDAFADLSQYARDWTGHKDTTLHIKDPRTVGAPSPWAAFSLSTHEMLVNADELLLNPNRVLLTITPFRLRQEAVLTGAMLHEAGHARHSLWMLDKDLLHTPRAGALKKKERVATRETIALAKVIEEPRIEGLIAGECNSINATGLAWTMRAMAAALLPPTILSDNSEQALMEIISSWLLRAGRQYATTFHVTSYQMAPWTLQFNDLLTSALEMHFINVGTEHFPMTGHSLGKTTSQAANHVLDLLVAAVQVGTGSDTGPGCIDRARDILDALFPETSGGAGKPMPGGGCDASESTPGEGDTGNESGEQGEPGQEGEGDEYEPGTGDDDLDAMLKDLLDPPAQDPDSAFREAMEAALDAMETESTQAVEAEAEAEQHKAPKPSKRKPTHSAGASEADWNLGDGFRNPTVAEREVKASATKFLRSVIDPTTAQRVTLSESPSTAVDPAALAAWRAGGQTSEPRFFKRTQRTALPAPPVKIGIQVDVSLSMDELAYPSSLLSFALASAAVDLRNFAGRGVQIESCLIHWGDDAKVIQRNGKPMPGIYKHSCLQGTQAMAQAHELLEAEIPGFHSPSAAPENRVLINFTDWIMHNWQFTVDPLGQAMEAGVNVITVLPEKWTPRYAKIEEVMHAVNTRYSPTGTHTLMRYDPAQPEQVWSVARELIAAGR